jgi:hypothetical protein
VSRNRAPKVKQTKPKKGKPSQSFMVSPTDLELPLETIVHYYRCRWELETPKRDTKQHFGFSAYQVQSQKRISRFVQLSFFAASLAQWIFVHPESVFSETSVEEVLTTLGIHWYHPKQLTRGFWGAYLRYLGFCHLFSAIKAIFPFKRKKQEALWMDIIPSP